MEDLGSNLTRDGSEEREPKVDSSEDLSKNKEKKQLSLNCEKGSPSSEEPLSTSLSNQSSIKEVSEEKRTRSKCDHTSKNQPNLSVLTIEDDQEGQTATISELSDARITHQMHLEDNSPISQPQEIHQHPYRTHPQDISRTHPQGDSYEDNDDEEDVLFDVKESTIPEQKHPDSTSLQHDDDESNDNMPGGSDTSPSRTLPVTHQQSMEELNDRSPQDRTDLAIPNNSHEEVTARNEGVITNGVVQPKGAVLSVCVAGINEKEATGESSEDHICSEDLLAKIEQLKKEKAELVMQLAIGKEKEVSFQEVAKELEMKCLTHLEKIEDLELEREKAADGTQKLEKELKLKIDQVTKLCDDAIKEKGGVIKKLAVLQEERRNLIDQVTEKEKRVKELTKENEKQEVLVKKQRAEVLKLQGNMEKNKSLCSQLTQDLSKEKEEVSSLNIKLKWAQNKLKSETEAHKNVKSQLEVTTKKLKQAREEGEQIRADLKQMIQQYQESEDMRSNTLDIKLKKTEEELKQQEQEIADQHELHELTVKELELTKTAHNISQEEVLQHKQKISEMTGRISELIAELEGLRTSAAKLKQENKKLSAEMSELDQHTQGFDKERVKFSQLREVFTQLQKSHQHMEKELEKRKERESELLAFSAKLSSSNAELTAERSDWETKVTSLISERDTLTAKLTESHETGTQLQDDLRRLEEKNQSELSELLDKLDGKTKAVEQLSMALEDERELVKAVKKKNTNVIKDLQRQLQSSNRRVENLEASISSEREPPATLPISHASSQSSLEGITVTSAPGPNSHQSHDLSSPGAGNASDENRLSVGVAATIPLSDDERTAATSSPEMNKFNYMDPEKMMLVEKMCLLKKEIVRQEEKMEFFEEHITQLTEDSQKKSRIIQDYIMREQSGALAPPSFDENKLRQSKKGGVMGTVFAGRAYKLPEVNYELSLEMNKKMQSVLEDTLLKNITLKENIDTLGREIQRISAQLQAYESSKR